MIQSFSDRETEQFFTSNISHRLPSDIRKRASMRLLQLNAAVQLNDLRYPPSID